MKTAYFNYLQFYCTPGNAYGSRNFGARNCHYEGSADDRTQGLYDADMLTCL